MTYIYNRYINSHDLKFVYGGRIWKFCQLLTNNFQCDQFCTEYFVCLKNYSVPNCFLCDIREM